MTPKSSSLLHPILFILLVSMPWQLQGQGSLQAEAGADTARLIARDSLGTIPYFFEKAEKDSLKGYAESINEIGLYYMQKPTEMSIKLHGGDRIDFGILSSLLKKFGLPDELKYIVVIESGGEQKALSPAGALGIWQLMHHTAIDYNLPVNLFIDTRYDIVLSTQAACRHFKRLFEKFRNWALVVAAYNWGEGNVENLILSKGTSDWTRLYPDFPEETKRYLAHFDAARMYGAETYPFLKTKKINSISLSCSFLVLKDELRPYNPHLVWGIAFRGCTVYFPEEHGLPLDEPNEKNEKMLSKRLCLPFISFYMYF